MIRRETEPTLLNRIANDPEVRQLAFQGMLYPTQDLDFESVFVDQRNRILSDGSAFGAIFKWTSPNAYECHIMALSHVRGAGMLRTAREMMSFMWSQGARLLWAQPSVSNKGALWFIRQMGFTPSGYGHDPFIGDVQYFVAENI